MHNLRLSIATATMASFSTMLLGMGQGSIWLPIATVVAAVGSVVLTDVLRWFRLHRIVANLAMIAAAVLSLYNFLASNSLDQLLAIARLLTYVQIVLFFQEKSVRIYGQLAMFSLLQVMVASLLNDSLEFGALLLGYMVIAVFGLTLFFAYREIERTGVVIPRRRWFVRRAVERPEANGAELRGQPPVLQVVDGPAVLMPAVVTRRLTAPLCGLLVGMLVFALVFFYTTPRTGDANWEGGSPVRKMVGFPSEISFDEMGELLQNKARAMRVSFTDVRTGEVYTVVREPYFRGTVLSRYLTDEGHGQWRRDPEPPGGAVLTPPPDTRDLVRQDILLEPTGRSQLFSLYPAYGLAESPQSLRVGLRSRRLYRIGYSSRDLTEEYRYSVATTAFRFGAQYQVGPYHSELQTAADREQLESLLLRLQFLDSRDELPQLIALADQVVRESAPQGNNFDKAKALEAHFQVTGRYTYSLRLDLIQPLRRANVDPVEDFVSNHRTGHCEYFASALTLMLRSQGIPARMVIGYKGGEYNYVGNYFVVRQEDAHAWVEAYMKPEEIPDDAISREERHAGGGWLRLDPTPALELEAPVPSLFDRASKSFDYARWLWNDYVLRLTSARQQESFLRPLAPDYELPIKDLLSLEGWKNWAREIASGETVAARRTALRWRGIAAALVTCMLGYGGYRLARASRPLFGALRARRASPARRRRRTVGFYQRLESILAARGLRRQPGQTQRELARAAATLFAASPDHAAVAMIPEFIVDAFYRVRFGDWVPDAQQEAELAAQLRRLEQLVTSRAARRERLSPVG